jgi:hypothetical protein
MGEGHWFGFRELVSELGEEKGVPVTGTRFCASAVFPHIVYAPSDDMTVAARAPYVRGNRWEARDEGRRGGHYTLRVCVVAAFVDVVYSHAAYMGCGGMSWDSWTKCRLLEM